MKKIEVQGGFTLVEIAIVMVIIGLLLGGALKGQQMIESAKIKSLLRFHDEFKAAYYFYQDIYRYLPGDDPNVATNFPDYRINLNSYKGNGDGSVGGNWRGRDTVSTNESVFLWAHLEAAGLIATYRPALGDWAGVSTSNTVHIPENVFGGAVGFEYKTESGYLGFPVLCFNGVPNDVALKIDANYDDGVANTGTVFATDSGADNKQSSYDYEDGALCFAL